LMIDGNRDGRFVLFDHEKHKMDHGGHDSCGQCHHMNQPLSRATACYECHADMYILSDIFNHSNHVRKMGGNQACMKCHIDPDLAKTVETTTPCFDCHTRMRVSNSLVKASNEAHLRMASGYMTAMHSLCIGCHGKKDTEMRASELPVLSLCTTCHKGVDPGSMEELRPHPPIQLKAQHQDDASLVGSKIREQ
ncbi:cytochrome c3 family protein, partial [Acidobacteriota bacterium]